MLSIRRVSKAIPALRYLAFGASPQRSGREVFSATERRMPRSVANGSELAAVVPGASVDCRYVCGAKAVARCLSSCVSVAPYMAGE